MVFTVTPSLLHHSQEKRFYGCISVRRPAHCLHEATWAGVNRLGEALLTCRQDGEPAPQPGPARSRGEWTQGSAYSCHHALRGLCLRCLSAWRAYWGGKHPRGAEHSTWPSSWFSARQQRSDLWRQPQAPVSSALFNPTTHPIVPGSLREQGSGLLGQLFRWSSREVDSKSVIYFL